MRYLRILTNCLVGGLVVAAHVGVIVLQLNPHYPLRPEALVALAVPLVLLYGVHAAVFFYLVVVCRQLVAAAPLSPGWVSLRLLAWLGAIAATGATAVMGANLRGFSTSLDPTALRRMAAGVIALFVVALVLLTLAILHYALRRRGTWLSASTLALALAASVGLPVAFRGPAVDRPLGAYQLDVSAWLTPSASSARVVLLAIDGASLEYIAPAVAEGRLPNFGRLLDAGASMHLATIHPTQPAPVWASVATGKYPWKHRVRAAATYELGRAVPPLDLLPDFCFAYGLVRFGLVAERPATSVALGARPLWSMLSRFGVPVGVVGWPLTYPAQPVLGYLVSDRFHLAVASPLAAEGAVAYPPEVAATAEVVGSVEGGLGDAVHGAGGGSEGEPREGPLRIPTDRDRLYRWVATDLDARVRPRFVTLRYQGLDLVAHRDFPVDERGAVGEGPSEPAARGRVLDEYYRFLDTEVGRAMAALGPDDLLLVVSAFGMRPVGLAKRLLARALGEPDLTGTHEGAPDGFLLAFGAAVEPRRCPRGSIVDVAPTVLYFLGAPVGRDLDGSVRTDLFRRSFTAERPITYIPTYER